MARSRRTSSRAIIVLVVLLLAAILAVVAAIGSQGFTIKNPKKWFNADYVGEAGDGVSLMTYAISAEDYAEYGISDDVLSAGILTAEYTPANATNKRTDWVFKFEENEWSEGKIVTDYMRFTPTANYAPECKYEVLQPFGASVIVGCTSRANPELKASTQIDYMIRYTDIGAFPALDYKGSINLFNGLYAEDKTCTIIPTSYSATVQICYEDWFVDLCGSDWDKQNMKGWQEFSNISATGEMTWGEIWNMFSESPYDPDVAKYCLDNNTRNFFEFEATITCYYEGKAVYTFTTECWTVEFSESCVDKMSVPPTNVTLPDNIVV